MTTTRLARAEDLPFLAGIEDAETEQRTGLGRHGRRVAMVRDLTAG